MMFGDRNTGKTTAAAAFAGVNIDVHPDEAPEVIYCHGNVEKD